MQLTEFVLRSRENGTIRNIKAFIDPSMPLSVELGMFFERYEVLESYPILKI